MADINDVLEAASLAKEYAKSVVAGGMGIEAEVAKEVFHISKGVTAAPLLPSEVDALSYTIGDIIDAWQELNPSIAKNWKASVSTLMLSAMLLKGITGGSFGEGSAEELPATLMATEIRPADLGLTSWSISTTAGDTIDLIGTPTSKLVLSQTTGERKVVCIIKNGLLTIDTPVPLDELVVEYEDKSYLPYAFVEGIIPAGQSENKLNYTARLNPIVIQPGIGVYVGGKANATVTTNAYWLGMTFYEKNAFNTL